MPSPTSWEESTHYISLSVMFYTPRRSMLALNGNILVKLLYKTSNNLLHLIISSFCSSRTFKFPFWAGDRLSKYTQRITFLQGISALMLKNILCEWAYTARQLARLCKATGICYNLELKWWTLFILRFYLYESVFLVLNHRTVKELTYLPSKLTAHSCHRSQKREAFEDLQSWILDFLALLRYRLFGWVTNHLTSDCNNSFRGNLSGQSKKNMTMKSNSVE